MLKPENPGTDQTKKRRRSTYRISVNLDEAGGGTLYVNKWHWQPQEPGGEVCPLLTATPSDYARSVILTSSSLRL
ncbi:hypothetical protein V6N12_040039 [Hibiscus sabdariffa]|uniref:Uncharacterized protein n=1 Tax=Hibiscus sabdariffa TaxID=183260 RepID=A0ABR2E2W7_9ROSI